MTDGRSRLVLVVIAALVLAVLGFWLWRSEPTVAPNPAPQPAVASDVATTLAAGNETAAAPIERTEAPAPPPPEPATNADLAHVRGRCVDEAGRPLANCTAKFDGRARNRQDLAMQGKVEWTDPEPAVTDADGRFDIAFAPPSGFQFGLDIQAEGRVPRTGRWGRIEPAQNIDLGDAVMVAGFEVRGRVVDEQGVPVASVGVMLKNLPLPLAADMSANDTRHGFSVTDGAFRLDVPIPVGTWALDVHADGVRLVSPDRVTVGANGADPVQVVVHRTPSIEGRVVDEQGQPVAGVYLNAEPHRSGRSASAWSRKDGTFVIHAVDAEPKPVKLVVSDSGPCEPSWTDQRPWEWGTRDVRIVLKRAQSFELTVVERGSGAPVTQYAVICYCDEPRSRRVSGLRLGGEHPGGRVTVDHVWRGKNVLYVVPIDRALHPSRRVQFAASDAGVPPMRVEVERLPRGTVRATTPGGEPVVGSIVEVVIKGTEPLDATSHVQDSRKGRGYSSDPSHRFHELTSSGVTGVDGRAEVFVVPDAHGSVVRVFGAHPPVVVDPAEFVSGRDFVIVMPDGGGIVGRVTLRDLQPRSISILAELTSGQERPRGSRDWVALDEDGGFALRGMPLGSYRVRLRCAVRYRNEHGGGSMNADLDLDVPEVSVLPGRDTEVAIDATAIAPAAVRGRVLLDGTVPSPARAFLRGEPGALYGQFLPGVAGEFEAMGLLPGTYVAMLMVGDFQAGEGDFIFGDATFTLAAGEHLVRDFAFTRRRLAVTLVHADGKTRAAGLRLVANGSHNFYKHFVADDNGVVVIDPAPAGRIDLQLPGMGQRQAVEVPVGKTEHAVTLTLPVPSRSK